MSFSTQHHYRDCIILYTDGRYRVFSDKFFIPTHVDSYLEHPYLSNAKRYVNTLHNIIYNANTEQQALALLAPFYKGYRHDGPLPTGCDVTFLTKHPATGCCHLTQPHPTLSLRWCNRSVVPGSTRCDIHASRWMRAPVVLPTASYSFND